MGEANVEGYAEVEGADECVFCCGSFGDGYGCNAEHDVWTCTRERGHEGEHVACGDLHARAKWIDRRASDAGGVTDGEREAVRYRWLRDRLQAVDWAYGEPPSSVVVFGWPETATISADLDSSIDAAIQRERAAKGEA